MYTSFHTATYGHHTALYTASYTANSTATISHTCRAKPVNAARRTAIHTAKYTAIHTANYTASNRAFIRHSYGQRYGQPYGLPYGQLFGDPGPPIRPRIRRPETAQGGPKSAQVASQDLPSWLTDQPRGPKICPVHPKRPNHHRIRLPLDAQKVNTIGDQSLQI